MNRFLNIYKRLKGKSYQPTHMCEVGVYIPETCQAKPFIQEGVKASLVEANPRMVEIIQRAFSSYPNVKIFPYAISDREGSIILYDRGPSTFIENIESPALVNDQYLKSENDRFEVPSKTFDKIDDGTIDVLCIDIEGAEWFVLDKLVSSPGVISIETHGKYYINPMINEIKLWMSKRGYSEWYKDKSDTVYVRDSLIPISILERVNLFLYNYYLSFRRMKGYVKGKLKQ